MAPKIFQGHRPGSRRIPFLLCLPGPPESGPEPLYFLVSGPFFRFLQNFVKPLFPIDFGKNLPFDKGREGRELLFSFLSCHGGGIVFMGFDKGNEPGPCFFRQIAFQAFPIFFFFKTAKHQAGSRKSFHFFSMFSLERRVLLTSPSFLIIRFLLLGISRPTGRWKGRRKRASTAM